MAPKVARAGGSRPPVAALLRRRSPKISGVLGMIGACPPLPSRPIERCIRCAMRCTRRSSPLPRRSSGCPSSISRPAMRRCRRCAAKCCNCATTGAAQIDVDLHAQLVSSSQEGSPEHERALAPLVRMHRASKDVLFMYTAIMRDGKVYWILDTARHYRVPGNDVPADPVMTPYNGSDPDLLRAFREQTAQADREPMVRGRSHLSQRVCADTRQQRQVRRPLLRRHGARRARLAHRFAEARFGHRAVRGPRFSPVLPAMWRCASASSARPSSRSCAPRGHAPRRMRRRRNPRAAPRQCFSR